MIRRIFAKNCLKFMIRLVSIGLSGILKSTLRSSFLMKFLFFTNSPTSKNFSINWFNRIFSSLVFLKALALNFSHRFGCVNIISIGALALVRPGPFRAPGFPVGWFIHRKKSAYVWILYACLYRKSRRLIPIFFTLRTKCHLFYFPR